MGAYTKKPKLSIATRQIIYVCLNISEFSDLFEDEFDRKLIQDLAKFIMTLFEIPKDKHNGED